MERMSSLFWKVLYYVFRLRVIAARGKHWKVYRHGGAKLFHYDLGILSRGYRLQLIERLKQLYESCGATVAVGRKDDDPSIMITAIVVEPCHATALWITGALTLNHLRSAAEDPEYIRIPDFPFRSHTVELILARGLPRRDARMLDSRPAARRVVRSVPGALTVLEPSP